MSAPFYPRKARKEKKDSSTTEDIARRAATGDRGPLGIAIDIAIRYRYRKKPRLD